MPLPINTSLGFSIILNPSVAAESKKGVHAGSTRCGAALQGRLCPVGIQPGLGLDAEPVTVDR
jgi:hypothetical protein